MSRVLMLGCTGFGLFDVSTRVMVPELEKLGAYLPPSIEKISVPLSGDAGWDDLIELSTIATQLFKATYSVLKFILKKVKKAAATRARRGRRRSMTSTAARVHLRTLFIPACVGRAVRG